MAKPALDVYLNGRLTGALTRKPNGNLRFRYAGEYVVGGGPPLSVSLPLRTEAYPHRSCLAFFGNLLPEEDVRSQAAIATGISAANDYKLLERFGGDVAGAVTLVPAGEPVESEAGAGARRPGLTPDELDVLLRELPRRPFAVDSKGEVRMSLAGAQSKLPVVETGTQIHLPREQPSTHILKPEPERFPGLVANELFCMRLAKEVGLEVASVRKAETLSGLPYLVVERYDRDMTQEPIRRLHQEDFCQALGRLHIEKYQHEGGPGAMDAMRLIDDRSAAPARDRQQFLLALAFNVLIGNCDAHGKNYSLLYDSPAPRLAPLYDLVSTAAYPELTTRLAMSIDGATHLGEVDERAWQRLAADIGFASRFVGQRLQPFANRVLVAAADLSRNPEHAGGLVTQIVAEIDERAERLIAPSSR